MNVSSIASVLPSKLINQASAQSSDSTSAPQLQKLRKAAGEFEALLLGHWWSAMKEGGLSGSDDESDPGKDTLDQLGIQAMSSAVAMGGGIGLGAMLVHGLLSNAAGHAAEHSPPATVASESGDWI